MISRQGVKLRGGIAGERSLGAPHRVTENKSGIPGHEDVALNQSACVTQYCLPGFLLTANGSEAFSKFSHQKPRDVNLIGSLMGGRW